MSRLKPRPPKEKVKTKAKTEVKNRTLWKLRVRHPGVGGY